MQNNLPFREVADLWKENKRSMVKHSTFCAYMLILKTHLLPKFGDVTTITESEAQRFALDKLNTGLSRKSVHDIIAVLKAVAKYGAKHEIFDLPSWDIDYPTETTARKLPVLSLSDHRKLLGELSANPTTQNIGIMIALCCGLRIGEVCALQWQNVDMQRRIITVSETVGRMSEIPLSPLLLNALRAVKCQQSGGDYVVGDGAKAKEPRTYRETFSRLIKRLKITTIVFHGLRHTFATRCIESGCDYKTVSVILGHSNVATTLNLYVHPNIDQKKRCIERLNKYLKADNIS